MSDAQQPYSKLGLAKTFLLPAFWIFLLPAISLAFFLHARSSFDTDIQTAILKGVRADQTMSEDEHRQALEFFSQVRPSQIAEHPQAAEMLGSQTVLYYSIFRWMIRLSAASIAAGVLVFVLGGLCVLLSLRSQLAQYWSLSVGWHVLRIYGAVQTLVMGILLVALSFWVTALWFDRYSVKLIGIVAILAVLAVGAVIAAMFKRVENDFKLEGELIRPGSSPPLWDELRAICAAVQTAPPDQVILGIDDNFFVTEQPLTVNDQYCTGRTLYVSLPLLKQLHGGEADAVLAHEMAHFSGQDTLYSQRISPLLVRYGHYLEALAANVVTLPIYYYMRCFRAMYEFSLSRLSRQRERRADQIAVETTSQRDLAGALLRIVAYSKYRDNVQSELFDQEQALESANVSERIEHGFPAYAVSFSSQPDIGELQTSHPFDSHPSISDRLETLGAGLGHGDVEAHLGTAGDGRWFRLIDRAEEIERGQWEQYEEHFRAYHEATLPYRFLPENEAEQAVVEKSFPEVAFAGTEGTLVLDYDKMHLSKWAGPIRYAEVSGLSLDDHGTLTINYHGSGRSSRVINTNRLADRDGALGAIEHYYGRYRTAVEYQQQKLLDAGT